MKKFSIVRWVAEVGFVSLLGACSSESVIANSVDSVNSSSSEAIISSSSEEPPSSSSVQEPFNPGECRTCDEKYEGKFLMRQYTEVLDVMGTSFIIATDFYKCGSGKWSGPFPTSPEELMEGGGDVIRVAPDDWVCSAENEGLVKPWSYMYAANHAPGRTPIYYARCEQGDWILCDEPDTTSISSLLNSGDWSWKVPKELRLNPEIEYDSITDSRDGKVYKTVKIGDQIWMAENLNFDPGQGGSGEDKYDWSWCFDNKSKNCDVAGRFYTWAAAIDSVKLANDADNPQNCGLGKTCTLPDTVYGMCPPGWHLPSYDEWTALFTAVGGQLNPGKVLKSQTGWNNNGNGTDAYGFSALPAGYRYYGGHFYGGGINAFYIYLYYYNEYADLLSYDKRYGSSVRCLRD